MDPADDDAAVGRTPSGNVGQGGLRAQD